MDEYEILALAKRLNITIDEMKEMSFVGLLNILISTIDSNSESDNVRTATQDDIDRVFG